MPIEIFFVGPLLALAVLVLVAVAADLRLVGPTGRSAAPDEFGLLRPVALLDDLAAARAVRNRLTALGIRATVGTGHDGFVRVLVFDDEYDRARDAV